MKKAEWTGFLSPVLTFRPRDAFTVSSRLGLCGCFTKKSRANTGDWARKRLKTPSGPTILRSQLQQFSRPEERADTTMNDLNRGFGAATTRTRAGEVDEGLRQYMLGVYNYMALAVAGTGLMSLFVASQPSIVYAIAGGPVKWVLFAAILGLGWFAPRVMFNGSKAMAHGMFWLYAGAWGLLIAPMLFAYNQAGLAETVYQAFFITAIVFASVSILGYTTKRDLSGMATFLFMASIGLLVAIVLNALIFKSTMMSLATSSLVVIVFSAVTAYETQMIKNMYQEGGAANDRASIFGAFALYGSFVTLFIHILNILGIMRSE